MPLTIDIKHCNSMVKSITISDEAQTCLLNDLLDIPDWIERAIEGKINNCKKRLLTEWHPRLVADPEISSL